MASESASCPYKLMVQVISARNLPVGDITTSDPFVVLSLAGKSFGKTKTIARTLNPEWNEGFYAELYHVDQSLSLAVYDEDTGKASDLLATLSLPLRSLSAGHMDTRTLPLQLAGNFKASSSNNNNKNNNSNTNTTNSKGESTITLSLLLARKEGTIKVVPRHRVSYSHKNEAKKKEEKEDEFNDDDSPLNCLTLLQQDLCWRETHEMVRNTLSSFLAEKLSFSLSLPIYRDFLHDVLSITSQGDTEHSSALSSAFRFKRYKPRWMSSSKLQFNENVFIRAAPIEDNSLQINLSLDETQFILLSFANRFAMWHWAHWLQRAREMWTTGVLSVREAVAFFPEEWTQPTVRGISSSAVSVHYFDSKQPQTTIVVRPPMRVSLSLDRPHALLVGDVSLSLQSMSSLVLSVDAPLPRGYTLELNLTLNTAALERERSLEGVKEKEKEKEKKRGSATASALSFLSNTAAAVVSTTHHVVSSSSSSQQNSLVVAACREETVRMDPRDEHSHWYVDFSLEDLETHSTASFLDRTIKRESSSSSFSPQPQQAAGAQKRKSLTSQAVALPPYPQGKLALDVSLLQGSESAEKIVAQGKCPLDVLLRKGNMRGVLGESLEEEVAKEVTFDRCIGFTISIETAQNLVVPEAALKPFTGLFAKCKLVGANGSSIAESNATESRTNSLSVSSAGRQQALSFQGHHNAFSFKHEQLAPFRSGFVRIEFLMGDGLATNTTLGAAYVPLDYCLAQLKPSVFAFPVVRRKAANATISLAMRDGKGLGDVLVRVQRIEDSTDTMCDKKSSKATALPTLSLATRVHECSVYNTQWFGECLSVGQRDMNALSGEAMVVERVQVLPHFQGLLLNDIQAVSVPSSLSQEIAVNSRGIRSSDGEIVHSPHASDRESRWKNSQRLSGERKSSFVSTSTPNTANTNTDADNSNNNDNNSNNNDNNSGFVEFVVEVFENQRRNPLPPFEWSPEAYTRARFSNADFSANYAWHDKEGTVLPEGCEWADKGSGWKIDKTHVKTDENGWIYGFTFGKLLAMYKQQRSHTTSLNAHARRRKWIRRVRVSLSSPSSPLISSSAALQKLFDQENDKSLSASPSHKHAHDLTSVSSPTENDNSWRDVLSEKCAQAILLTCEERESRDAAVLIPWQRIESLSLVSPSILAVSFTVRRFFPAQRVFRPAQCVCYISNCLAHALQRLFAERLSLCATRTRLQEVREDSALQLLNSPIKSSRSKSARLREVERGLKPSQNRDSDDDSEEEDDEGEAGEGADTPATQELSQGSELMASMDDEAIALQREISRLDSALTAPDAQTSVASSRPSIQALQTALYHRCCRLRLYMAALIALEIQDWHDFKADNALRILDHDFATCRRISLEDSVSTAQNRIDFLLDVAEKRIRDAALCGWRFREHDFVVFVETFANDYFVEIVGLLAAFFEEKGQSNVKGLVSKVTLLQTFIRNNDRLQTIVESALRPYALTTEPLAKLSVFLDINLLVDWYREVLQNEMRLCVSNVFEVWRDREKNVTGQSDLYSFPIAWVPQRLHEKGGVFLTNIPEDIVEYLLTYLTNARLKKTENDKNNLDGSSLSGFAEYIDKLDTKVFSAYSNAFIFVAELYAKELHSFKPWYAVRDEEELNEYITWVCSIANDAERVMERELMIPHKMMDSVVEEETKARDESFLFQVRESTKAFELLRMQAVDQLSCVLFKCVFHDKEEMLHGPQLWLAFKKFHLGEKAQNNNNKNNNSENNGDSRNGESNNNTNTDKSSATGDRKFLDDIFDDCLYYLHENRDFLSNKNYSLLVEIAVNKLLSVFFALLVQARLLGEALEHSSSTDATASDTAFLLHLLAEEGISLRQRLQSLIEDEKVSLADSLLPATATEDSLQLLGPLLHLLLRSVSEAELQTVIESVNELVARTFNPHSLAESAANYIRTCMSLKGVGRFFSDEQRSNDSHRHVSVDSNARGSEFHGTTASPRATPRRSIKDRVVGAVRAHPPGSRIRKFLGFGATSPPPSDNSPSECEEEHGWEESQSLEDAKNDALGACIDQLLHDSLLKNHPILSSPLGGVTAQDVSSRSKMSELLIAKNAFVRSFSSLPAAMMVSSSHTLEVYVLYSALSALQLKTLLPEYHEHSLAAVGHSVRWAQSHSHSSDSRPAAMRRMNSRFKAALLSPASFYESTANMLSPSDASSSSMSAMSASASVPLSLSGGESDDSKLLIVVHDLRVDDLFFLFWLQTPRPFIVARVEGHPTVCARTEARECVDGGAVWPHDAVLGLKLPEVTSSQMEIVFDLVYERLVRNTAVASAKIAFNPFDPPTFTNKEIVFTEFSAQAKQAAHQAEKEGRPMPKLTVSLQIISHMI